VPLTDSEKVSIRYHLGYMNVAETETFALGTPAATETSFIIESAMDKVPEIALPRVRFLIGRCDSLENQMASDEENLAVSKLGDITLREDEQDVLDARYERWRNRLAQTLGVYVNPYDKVSSRGINVPVMS